MKYKNKIILTIVIVILGVIFSLVSLKGIYLVYRKFQESNLTKENSLKIGENKNENNIIEGADKDIKNNNSQESEIENKNEKQLAEPIAEFEKRITKKSFGIYITPQNSPVQGERFQGYHTGVDVEYEDSLNEVEVKSIASGKIILSKWVSGYGGVVAIEHNINDENIISLSGHLDPNSLISLNSEIEGGNKIGILGDGFTSETDNERKHLHFAILKGDKIDLKGYVQKKDEIDKWYDPIEFLNN
jgi:murein DD-endopeptidase MepM/ murein hydrolase activator NlpD